MYDRYSITKSNEELHDLLQRSAPAQYQRVFNGAPARMMPVLTQGDESIRLMYWGTTPKVSKDKPISTRLINTPRTHVLEKPIYRKLLQQNRCLILADGFFTWKQVSKKQRIPYYCYLPGRALFGIAGIWESSEDFEGAAFQAFSMITTAASASLQDYQDDMPCIIRPDHFGTWLSRTSSTDTLATLLTGNGPALQIHAVSPLLLDTSINEERIIKPAPPSDQFGNYTLFS